VALVENDDAARALDADLGRKVAKTEAPVSGVADMGLGQFHQSLSGLTHG
jgi:hypothetical protein